MHICVSICCHFYMFFFWSFFVIFLLGAHLTPCKYTRLHTGVGGWGGKNFEHFSVHTKWMTPKNVFDLIIIACVSHNKSTLVSSEIF